MLAWEHLGVLPGELEGVARERDRGLRYPVLDKWHEMDGWIDCVIFTRMPD